LYVASSVVKRFALEKRSAGRAFHWKNGELAAAPASFVQARSSALSIASAAEPAQKVAEALSPKWQSGAFVALHGSRDRNESTGHRVVWLPLDASGQLPVLTSTKDATDLPHEVVFGGGKYGAPRDGVWSWKIGEAGEDPVTPVGVAVSPADGALYVSSDNAAEAGEAGGLASGPVRSGSIYRIARLGK
jgi:glucose/arabinose dehydrogenase